MAKVLKVVLAFFAGLVVVWVATAAAGFAYMDYFHIFDRDGGGSMALIFIIGPFCGSIGGLVAAVLMARRLRARPPG